ncbi:AMP-binding protein [Pseudonocardia acidicola]|uniref:Acyl-CoA synthetase n=1 Tax=Pseudonocardia acidicola TaxID=2724939 RepID=A0ABX1SB73_9PSEU|nr:acyl-CoA synthetase [Pseudonocardia acidicola]
MYPGTHARTTPDKPAIIMSANGRTVTYAQLDDRSARLARVLRAAGLTRGDHVAVVTDNAPEAFEVYWAAVRSGLYITAVNHHLSAPEIGYIVDDCEARVLVVSAGLREAAEAIVPLTPRVQRRLAFGTDARAGERPFGTDARARERPFGGPVDGYDDYTAALAGQPGGPLDDQPCGVDMLYSSGTTGRPKGIRPELPDRQVDEPGNSVVAAFGPLYGFDADTVYYSPAPVYHAAPLRFSAMTHALGGTLVMADRFDAETALRDIERYRITHSQWVPTMFVRMLQLDPAVRARYDVSSQRAAIHAAAPCPVEVKQRMLDWWGPILHEYYGATEGSGITVIGPHDWLAKPGSVGRAALGTLRICDDDGRELPVGGIGTVYFERDEVPFRYHNDDEKTRSAQHPEHETWSTTGDIGYLDHDGYLFLTDRRAFTIISGGVNIYPQETEDCLALHPSVYDVAVIGVPDDEMGEQVKAVVVPAQGAEPGPALEKELLDFVRERIARYKAPRSVDFVDELPRTPTGKLVKRVLVDRYRAAR